MTDDIKEKIRTHVRDVLSRKGDSVGFDDDESLLVSGRLDSFAVVEIVAFLEDEFGIDLAGHIFEAEDFDSIESIFRLTQG